MEKQEIINNLKELKKEHRNFWVQMGDKVSPRIIENTIKFIREIRNEN